MKYKSLKNTHKLTIQYWIFTSCLGHSKKYIPPEKLCYFGLTLLQKYIFQTAEEKKSLNIFIFSSKLVWRLCPFHFSSNVKLSLNVLCVGVIFYLAYLHTGHLIVSVRYAVHINGLKGKPEAFMVSWFKWMIGGQRDFGFVLSSWIINYLAKSFSIMWASRLLVLFGRDSCASN